LIAAPAPSSQSRSETAGATRVAGGHPVTPDGRYFVVRGRLWRMSDPALSEDKRAALVGELMRARRAVATARKSGDALAKEHAHKAVDRAKCALGERGPVWWNDGAADLNRHLARTGPYADWYAALDRSQS
jgi:hypothetical protein